MYIERAENCISRKGVTYSEFVGIPKAVLACFICATLLLHRYWMSCYDLSVYGVSSTKTEAKSAFSEEWIYKGRSHRATQGLCIGLPHIILLMRRPDCSGATTAAAVGEAAASQEVNTLWANSPILYRSLIFANRKPTQQEAASCTSMHATMLAPFDINVAESRPALACESILHATERIRLQSIAA